MEKKIKKKCFIIMLPTDKVDGCLLKGIGTLQRFPDKYFTQEYLKETKRTSHHLYIVDDSEIKKGDYGIGFAEGIKGIGRGHYLFYHDRSSKAKLNVMAEGSKKVIASTDKSLNLPSPSEQFIRKFMESYNKNYPITEVEIEWEIDKYDVRNQYKDSPSGKYWEDEPVPQSPDNLYTNAKYYKPKIDSKNQITITRCKDFYSREEVIKLIEEFYHISCNGEYDDGGEFKRNKFNKWTKENL